MSKKEKQENVQKGTTGTKETKAIESVSEFEGVDELVIDDGVESDFFDGVSEEADNFRGTAKGSIVAEVNHKSDMFAKKAKTENIKLYIVGASLWVVSIVLTILFVLSVFNSSPKSESNVISGVTNEIWGNESVKTVTSVKGLEFTVPETWTVNNFWEYSQATLSKPKENSGSGASTDEIFEGIVVTTGYLDSSSDNLEDFANQVYSAVAETSETSSSKSDKTIGSENAKYIEMSKDGNYAGMYYIFHDNLAIEIVCSASSKDTLESYQSEVEKIVKGFRYMKVSASDFETSEVESNASDTSGDESKVESSKDSPKVENSKESSSSSKITDTSTSD